MRRLHVSLLAFLPMFALAQGTSHLSLAEAESLWRAHGRELRLARIAVDAAEADLQIAGQRPNPELSTNVASISPWSGYGNGGWKDKRVDTIVRLEQLIELGNKRGLRQRGAEERLAAARLDVDDLLRQQLRDLRQAYFDLKLAQEKLSIAGEMAALYGRSLEAGRLRQKAGDIAPVDVSRLAVDQARAEAEQRQAQADLEGARRNLAYLIGREQDAKALVAGDDWPRLAALPDELAVTDGRPDIAAARRRIDAAEADRDLARAKRTRDVTVGVQYERNQQNSPLNSYGVGVSVPLFVWHGHEGDIARAEADLQTSRELYGRQRAVATGEIAQARNLLSAARDRLQRLESGMLQDAERVAQAAELAYAKGAMGLIDLLDARRTLRQLRVEAVTARADYAKAWADWQAQMDSGKTP